MTDIWDSRRGYTRVALHGVQTEARVGLHPWERHAERPTRLLVDVEMFAHTPLGGDILDYDPIRAELRTWPQRPHTDLLETLVDTLVDVCFGNPRVEACRVRVTKTQVFNEAEGASVESYRVRDAP